MFWAQSSRAKWLKDGDRNSKYFHVLASVHKRKNTITSLSTNGFLIDDLTCIQEEAISFFSNIFKEEFSSWPTFDGLNFKNYSLSSHIPSLHGSPTWKLMKLCSLLTRKKP